MASHTAFDLSPDERWLFLFAHPDDEVAVIAWMRELIEAGVPVHAMWMHSTPRRQKESEAVLDLIGLPSDAQTYWQLPDGHLVDHLNEMEMRLLELVDRWKPTRLATMAFEQGHLDHDSCHFIARKTTAIPVCEFPMYWAYHRSFMHLNTFATGNFETRRLDQRGRELKRRAIRMYPSQTIYRNIVAYGLLRRLVGTPSEFDAREVMRISTVTDFTIPALPEALARLVIRSPRWHRWVQAVNAYQEQNNPCQP